MRHSYQEGRRAHKQAGYPLGGLLANEPGTLPLTEARDLTPGAYFLKSPCNLVHTPVYTKHGKESHVLPIRAARPEELARVSGAGWSYAFGVDTEAMQWTR